MTVTTRLIRGGDIHPLHAILLSFPVALFSSALVSDVAYLQTSEIQWSNFSAWLIAGALLFLAPVVVWAAVGAVLPPQAVRRPLRLAYLAAVAAAAVLGLINAFKHSQDGWSSVGAFGVILSVLCTLFILVAAVIAFCGLLSREAGR